MHWSWVFVAALVVLSLATALFPSTYPGLAGSSYLIMAVVAGLLFFVSILLHELRYTMQALRERMRIRDVTLWLFGGVASFADPFASPAAEFRVAADTPGAARAPSPAFSGSPPGQVERQQQELDLGEVVDHARAPRLPRRRRRRPSACSAVTA